MPVQRVEGSSELLVLFLELANEVVRHPSDIPKGEPALRLAIADDGVGCIAKVEGAVLVGPTVAPLLWSCHNLHGRRWEKY